MVVRADYFLGDGPRPVRLRACVLQLRTVSGYTSTAVLPLNLFTLIFYLLCLNVPVVRSVCLVESKRKKEPGLYNLCVFCVINGVRRVYFNFLQKKKYECLRCHCPLTCPAGWKGFLTHPSHASALHNGGGVGRRQARLGI